MRKVTHFEWLEETIRHIGRHGVHPEEVEEACYHRPLIFKGRGRFYLIYGQTNDGRYLLVVARYLGQGTIRTITARDMTDAERRLYAGRK